MAAKVNGTELTVHQVNYALQRIPNLDKDQTKAASLQVVRNLVDQEVITQKALADKLDRDPMVVQALDAARRQILAEAYMSRKLGTPAEPTDAEVLDYFDKHPDLFAQRKIYRLQEISIKAPQDKHDAIRAQLGASKNLNDFAAWLKAENLPVKAAQGVKPAEQLPLQMLPQLSKMPHGQAMVVDGASDWTGLGARIAACWPALPPELVSLGHLANRLEGGAWLAAGSGGLLVAWLPAGTWAAFLSEARAAGLRPVSCRLDLRGAAGPDA